MNNMARIGDYLIAIMEESDFEANHDILDTDSLEFEVNGIVTS